MDLDFKTVKALSSPTRIEILSYALENEATPTKTAQEIGKTKSTASSHLEKLVGAGLLKKDEKKGRKRVVYRPTEKAKAIVKGRKRKVKFSITSSVVTTLAGLALLLPAFTTKSSEPESSDPDLMTEEAAEPATELGIAEPFLIVSLLFFIIAVTSLAYGLAMRKLG